MTMMTDADNWMYVHWILNTQVSEEEEMKNNGGGLSVNLCVCESPCVRVYFARSHRNQKAKNCIQFFFASQV